MSTAVAAPIRYGGLWTLGKKKPGSSLVNSALCEVRPHVYADKVQVHTADPRGTQYRVLELPNRAIILGMSNLRWDCEGSGDFSVGVMLSKDRPPKGYRSAPNCLIESVSIDRFRTQVTPDLKAFGLEAYKLTGDDLEPRTNVIYDLTITLQGRITKSGSIAAELYCLNH